MGWWAGPGNVDKPSNSGEKTWSWNRSVGRGSAGSQGEPSGAKVPGECFYDLGRTVWEQNCSPLTFFLRVRVLELPCYPLFILLCVASIASHYIRDFRQIPHSFESNKVGRYTFYKNPLRTIFLMPYSGVCVMLSAVCSREYIKCHNWHDLS